MRRAPSGSVLQWSRDELYAGVRAAKSEIVIVSPYISRGVAMHVAQVAGASKAKTLRLLTCLSPAATAAGVLDRDALFDLLRAGWELRTGRNLHAKVALVDREWGLIGSGNLTARGLGGEEIKGNAELGVVLSTTQVARTHRIVARWWKEAEPIDEAMIESCPPRSRGRGAKQTAVGPDLGSQRESFEDRPPRDHTGFWLKMVYDAEERRGAEWWKRQDWLSDRHLLREGGRPILQPGGVRTRAGSRGSRFATQRLETLGLGDENGLPSLGPSRRTTRPYGHQSSDFLGEAPWANQAPAGAIRVS
jgi:hypothetical protein